MRSIALIKSSGPRDGEVREHLNNLLTKKEMTALSSSYRLLLIITLCLHISKATYKAWKDQVDLQETKQLP